MYASPEFVHCVRNQQSSWRDSQRDYQLQPLQWTKHILEKNTG